MKLEDLKLTDKKIEGILEGLKGCVKCGRGDINYPIWVHQNGIEPPDCYCDRFIEGSDLKKDGLCKKYKTIGEALGQMCIPDWTKYLCQYCSGKKSRRMLRPVSEVEL